MNTCPLHCRVADAGDSILDSLSTVMSQKPGFDCLSKATGTIFGYLQLQMQAEDSKST